MAQEAIPDAVAADAAAAVCSSSRCVVATVQPLFSPPTSANAGADVVEEAIWTPLSVPPSPVPISSPGAS
jgi:hypothetical protein